MCEDSSIPDRLKRNGRPVDNQFSSEERLYRRITSESLESDDSLTKMAVKFPRCSVNRGKYCEHPTDVLYPDYFHLGVASYTVGSIPKELILEQNHDNRRFAFNVQHVPCENMYPHSHVCSGHKRVPKSIKSRFRILLWEGGIQIDKRPD